MQNVVGEVMNELVYGTTAFYAVPTSNDALGLADARTLQLIADQALGTTPTLTARVQHAADGEHRHDRNASPDEKNDIPFVSSVPFTAGTTNSTAGGDESSVASLRHVRLRINLEGTTPRVRVRIFVCGRGKPVSEMRVLGESATEFPIPDFQHEAKARPKRSSFATAPDLGARAFGRPTRQARRRAP